MAAGRFASIDNRVEIIDLRGQRFRTLTPALAASSGMAYAAAACIAVATRGIE